nr:MAG TPA: DNA repair photolyase [Caudoviricetes sp.]
MDKSFNGKAIYNPKGKAGEYSQWACNFYTGCSNDCEYCYCKKGFMGRIWSNKPQLKKCFNDEKHALEVFTREIDANIEDLKSSGIFFTFTSDPMLPETIKLTVDAIGKALERDIPVQILTKRADFTDQPFMDALKLRSNMVAWGFTLTGHDELEPGASSNFERIQAMKQLHCMGFKTFASIEPIIDFPSAFSMLNLTRGFCDLYKLGLMSGKKYNHKERNEAQFLYDFLCGDTTRKFYIKDSLLKLLFDDRSTFPKHFVDKEYNIFSDIE